MKPVLCPRICVASPSPSRSCSQSPTHVANHSPMCSQSLTLHTSTCTLLILWPVFFCHVYFHQLNVSLHNHPLKPIPHPLAAITFPLSSCSCCPCLAPRPLCHSHTVMAHPCSTTTLAQLPSPSPSLPHLAQLPSAFLMTPLRLSHSHNPPLPLPSCPCPR